MTPKIMNNPDRRTKERGRLSGGHGAEASVIHADCEDGMLYVIEDPLLLWSAPMSYECWTNLTALSIRWLI